MINGEERIAMPQFHVQLQFTYVKKNDDFGTIPSDRYCDALRELRERHRFS